MRGGGSSGPSHAPPRSIPDRRAPVDSSRALMSFGRARCPLTRRNLLLARNRPAAHHRRISPSRHRVTRAVTRRVTERADSMGLVVANVRRNAPARPSRTTASVSSNPSRRLAAIRSSQRAVASSDALAAS